MSDFGQWMLKILLIKYVILILILSFQFWRYFKLLQHWTVKSFFLHIWNCSLCCYFEHNQKTKDKHI